MSNMNHERVLSVHHWNDTLFSFKCTRDPGLRFENGQFVMIGPVVKIDPAGGPLQVYATIPYDQLHPDAQYQGGPRSLAVRDGKAWLSTNDGHVVVVDLLDTPVPYPMF